MPAQKKTAQPINVLGFVQRIFDGDLSRQGREIAITNLHLDRPCPEMVVFETRRNVGRLTAQTRPQHFPIVGILQEGFFAADALDLFAQFERAIVLDGILP